MTARLTVVLLAAGLLVAGCGGGSGERKAVARYIDSVNAIQTKLRKPLLAISKADRDFATGHAKPADVRRRLSVSTARVRRLRKQLAALTPPPPARRLQSLLVRLVDRQVALAGEVRRMAAFFPRFSAALAPVAPASKALKRALAGKGNADAKAAALERYSAALAAVVVEVQPLEPPPVSAPVYRSELSTLEQVRATADALALAVRQKQSTDIPRLLHDFDVASVGNQTIAAQKAQIAAVRAYDARVKSLNTLAARIAKEQTRLRKTL